MKKAALILTAAVLAAVMLLPAAFGQEDDEMPRLGDEGFESYRRPLAVFPHMAHMEYEEVEDCWVCHHVYEDGKLLKDESSEGEPCSACHSLEEIDSQPGLMDAYHLNCKGCHEEIKKGPITCGECHVR